MKHHQTASILKLTLTPTALAALFRIAVIAVAMTLLPSLVLAQSQQSEIELSQIFAATDTINKGQRSSQGRINQLVDETTSLEGKYKLVLKEIEGLRIYNEQLRKQIAVQVRTIVQTRESIIQSVGISRQITPLMIRMVNGLEQFVNLDVPFSLKERKDRVARLRAVMSRSDVEVSEKFSAVLNAYQIENEYGRTVEAYSDILPGTNKVVDFLRFGRITLVYQSTDGNESGVWNGEQFEELSSSYNTGIKRGIRIARKQSAVDMIVLPVLGSKES